MNDIEVHSLITKILQSFYRLRLWNVTEKASLRITVLKLLQLFYFASFVASMAVGACMSYDKDEYIFLTVAAMINGVIVYRMATIIWKKNEILLFVRELGKHSIEHEGDFIRVNIKLENFIKFAKAFILMCVLGVTFALFVPVISSENKLVFNIALPPQWKNNEVVFWIAHLYSVLGCTYSSLSLLLSVIIWYLMINCAIQYEMLGNQLRNLGLEKMKASKEEIQKLFLQDLIAAIEIHLKLKKYIVRRLFVTVANL